MSDQPQLVRPETDAGKEEKGRAMEELPLQSSPYVKYSDVEVYKLPDYDSEDHFPTIKTTRRAGSATGSPTLSRSASNSPSATHSAANSASLARSLSLKVRNHSQNNSRNWAMLW